MRFLFLLALGFRAQAEIVSFGVGLVQGEAVTSREVRIGYFVAQALDLKSKQTLKVGALDTTGKFFTSRAQQTLRDTAIAIEARNFNVIQILPEEQMSLSKQVESRLRGNEAWKNLQASPADFERALRREILARKFIHFREQNSLLPVTDAEAEREYNDNRKKYGELSFAKAKENIKSTLSHVRVEARMKDWYDGIDSKYHVKNLISENE